MYSLAAQSSPLSMSTLCASSGMGLFFLRRALARRLSLLRRRLPLDALGVGISQSSSFLASSLSASLSPSDWPLMSSSADDHNISMSPLPMLILCDGCFQLSRSSTSPLFTSSSLLDSSPESSDSSGTGPMLVSSPALPGVVTPSTSLAVSLSLVVSAAS